MSFRIILVSITFLVVLVKGISPSYGACLTYRDVIRDALDNSARVRMKIEDIHILEATCRQTFASLYPSISVNSRLERYENLDKRTQQGITTISGEVVGGDVSAWRSTFYLWGEYTISNWYKKRFEALYYEKLKDARVHDCQVEVKRLMRELTDLYAVIAEGKIRLKYGDEILQRLHNVLALKKTAFSRGQISREEVIKAGVDVASLEREIAGIKKEMKENLEKLHSYTARTYAEDAAIELFASHGWKHGAETDRVVEDTPEYKVRMKELEAVRERAKVARNNFWPDVSLYGRYDYYGSDTHGMDNSLRYVRETSYRAGILISLPLFDGGSRKWERAKSEYEIKRQEESIKAIAEEKERDMMTLSTGYQELSKALMHYKKLNEQYGKMVEITRKAHTLGERSTIDILEMEKEALAVERDVKVAEHTIATYEKRLFLETDFVHFMQEHYGDGACKH